METLENQVAPEPVNESGEEPLAPETNETNEFGPEDSGENSEPEAPAIQDPVEKFHKRLNKLVAQRNTAQDQVTALQAQVAQLSAKVDAPQSNDDKLTIDQVKGEISKVRGTIESGDYSHKDIVYLDQLRDLHTEKLLTSTKDEALNDINKQTEATAAVQKEWQGVTQEYSQYGISDTKSDLFRLSKAYYEHPTMQGKYVGPGAMRLAVADAFRDLISDGDIPMKQPLGGNNQQLLKEKRKNALGTGGSGDIEASNAMMSEKELKDDYFAERLKIKQSVSRPPQYQYKRASK